ncbi:polysaccharide pyruvyl transferase family protein [Sphingomonas faeni]|uniref:polysaccharide pyruvyl transferase family protein n=1 Tax=Sphingomonas faeni TaxID=185950 RepID=UPI003349C55F
MKLYFFRGEVPNFGDELNLWLMPKVFPELLDEDCRVILLAIGSVLFDNHAHDSLKVVFGSGYGAYTSPPNIDKNWRVYAVRGPRTAAACGIPIDMVAGDTAILVRRFREKNPKKRYSCAFMPHWQSIKRGNWEAVCRRAGIHFLDPRAPVETLLDEIEASELVITEAMHGAIVADALRVPWIPIMPFEAVHRFKWFDWAEALDVRLRPRKLFPSSTIEARMAWAGKETGRLRDAGGAVGLLLRTSDQIFERLSARTLSRMRQQRPQLSQEDALELATVRLEHAASEIRRDFTLASGELFTTVASAQSSSIPCVAPEVVLIQQPPVS